MRKGGDNWKDEKRKGKNKRERRVKGKMEKNCWEWPVSWEAQEASGSGDGAPGGHLSSLATTTNALYIPPGHVDSSGTMQNIPYLYKKCANRY